MSISGPNVTAPGQLALKIDRMARTLLKKLLISATSLLATGIASIGLMVLTGRNGRELPLEFVLLTIACVGLLVNDYVDTMKCYLLNEDGPVTMAERFFSFQSVIALTTASTRLAVLTAGSGLGAYLSGNLARLAFNKMEYIGHPATHLILLYTGVASVVSAYLFVVFGALTIVPLYRDLHRSTSLLAAAG